MVWSVENGREVRDIKDIRAKSEKKTKERSSSARMPKELVRTAARKAEERTGRLTHATESMEDSMEESPHEYAATKVTSAGRWTGGHAMGAAYAGGKKLAIKTREKTQEKRRKVSAAGEDAKTKAPGGKTEGKDAGERATARKAGQQSAARKAGQESAEGKIRTRKVQRTGIKHLQNTP